MHCPKCKYTLTEGERVLCRLGGSHYCPRCWARISREHLTPPPVVEGINPAVGIAGKRNTGQ